MNDKYDTKIVNRKDLMSPEDTAKGKGNHTITEGHVSSRVHVKKRSGSSWGDVVEAVPSGDDLIA